MDWPMHHSIFYIWVHHCLINQFSELFFPLNYFPNDSWHCIRFLRHSWILTSCFQRRICNNSVNADLDSRLYIKLVVQHFCNCFSLACMLSTLSTFLPIIVLIFFSKICYVRLIKYYSWYPLSVQSSSSAAAS